MNFDTETLIVAFPPSEMANLEAYRNLYGADLPTSGNRHRVTVKTLLAHDDLGCPDGLRAGMMPTTVSARSLTDGRYAVAGKWSLALKDAWENGDVQAEILTVEQLQSLTPQSDI
jgi:hypothetical protein